MKNIYLFVSEDDYILNEETNKLIARYSDYDLIKYDMIVSSLKEVIQEISSRSLFALKKLIVCYNSNFLHKDEDSSLELLDDNLKYMDEDVIVVFSTNKVDSRKKIVNKLKKESNYVEIETKNSNYFKDYVNKNIKMTNNALVMFLEKTNNNLGVIKHEIEKLKIYKDTEINEEDIIRITPSYKEFDTFMLIDAILKKDTDKMLEIYKDLIIMKEEPIKILVTLSNQIRLIYQVKILSKKMSDSNIATYLDVNPYRVKLAKEKMNSFSIKELENYLLDLADLDIKIKTNELDKNSALEMFFLKI